MIIKRNYEISIWEQKGADEIKLGIIGSNFLDSPGKAQKPILTRNTNGTKKLEFYLFYEYFDEIEQEIKQNPYCPLLVNGRKIKLNWKNKWYEFIITNIVESSEDKKITYVAQDASITELSRKGFNIEFSTDMKNNQGTIFQLTNQVLKNSDWTLDEANSLVGPQVLEEILVELEVTNDITTSQATFLDANNSLSVYKHKVDIKKGTKIYGFYSSIAAQEDFFQFYYLEDGKYQINEDGFIYNCPLYILNECSYSNGVPKNTKKIQVVNIKGKKLIRSQKTEYNNVLETYTKLYKNDSDEEIVGYTKTEYYIDDFVTNLVTNDKDYITDIGWYSAIEGVSINQYNYPEGEVLLDLIKKNNILDSQSYLQINLPSSALNTWSFYNSGPNDNKKALGKLYKGKKFVIKLKYKYNKQENNFLNLNSMPYNKETGKLLSGLCADLCSYKYSEEGFIYVNQVLASTGLSGEKENTFKKEGDYWIAKCECNATYTEEQLNEMNLGLFFRYDDTKEFSLENVDLSQYYFYIEDCQFFEFKARDEENKAYYFPGELIEGETKIRYSYFLKNQDYNSEKEIKYLYSGYTPQDYKKVYYEDFPQIKIIEEKESNIFNLIQTLCENFGCWADFVIEHEKDGTIKKDSNGNPIKKIRYRAYLGKENWSGYRRGINLKTINRTLDSAQVTTKTIVKPNSNEFAPDGFCTIAYSKENPSGENFIYDFSHYVSKGLINKEELHKDLYGEEGLYVKLKEINEEIKSITDELLKVSNKLLYDEKEKEVYSALVSELNCSIAENKQDFRLYSGISYISFLKQSLAFQKEKFEEAGVRGTFSAIIFETAQLTEANNKLQEISKKYKDDFKEYKNLKEKIQKQTDKKNILILNFETKYSNFIQEGVWISESHIDHDLYYVEATEVASTSAIPKVTYNIDVIDISSLEEFFNYDIDIGDKTYIIDPEFFGYLNETEIKTPKKQEVIITELIEDLENPENNRTVIQSYKTQFDDLFQRVTATSQQLKLNEGVYNRAAGAFSNYGLDSSYTQKSLNSTNFSLENNTVKWDVEGLKSVNEINKNNFIKMHNGSLYLTNDGGVTWNTAISGKGINANYIYAGQLDAGKINIVSELKVSEEQDLEYCLTLDKLGLSMYSFNDNKKITRIRLGRVTEDSEDNENDLYGLQLYNNNGEQTFRTDSNGDIIISGTIYANDGYFNGKVVANEGYIGGWVIEENQLNHQSNGEIDAIISTEELDQSYQVNNKYTNDWRLLFGVNDGRGNFGVTGTGNLYANGVDIKDGNISFGDLFKITSNGNSGANIYNLDIDISNEDKDKSIIVSSEDRVIGIREKQVDTYGDSKWVWKTILGDLSSVKLGESSLKDYLPEEQYYGLCTENGIFSGVIVSSQGKIGNFIIGENELYTNNMCIFNEINGELELNIENGGIYFNNDGEVYFGDSNNYFEVKKNEENSNFEISLGLGGGKNNGIVFSKEGIEVNLVSEGEKDIRTKIDDKGIEVLEINDDNTSEVLMRANTDGVLTNLLKVNNSFTIGNFEFKYDEVSNKVECFV